MKAVLIGVSLMTRIVVDDDFDPDELRYVDYDTIRKKAYPILVEQLYNDGVGDHLDICEDDEEMPFGSCEEDKIYS